MMEPARVLVIEDDPEMADALCPLLEDQGFEVVVEMRGDLGLARAQGERFDAVLTDVWLPGLDGLEVTRRLRLERARLPVVVMTAHGTTETAIEAMKLGAYEYLLKPFSSDELLVVLQTAVEAGRRMTERVSLGQDVPVGPALIGRSRLMQGVYREIMRVAGTGENVLIRGETGTGRQLVARAIYQQSERADQPFVPVECSNVPETTLESELFGHERGAFVGAEPRRVGRIQQASGGVLYLDEVGDLAPGTQSKLYRFLHDRTFQPVGGRETIRADVRIVVASQYSLETRIARGEFREDLYKKLVLSTIHIPPLRERLDDLPALVTYFCHRHGLYLGTAAPSFSMSALERLRVYPWPGNVRELEEVVRKAIGRAQGFAVSHEHVEAALTAVKQPATETGGDRKLGELAGELVQRAMAGEIDDARNRIVALAEREILNQAMDRAQGDHSKAARWLGISRLTLREKLRQSSRGWGRNANVP